MAVQIFKDIVPSFKGELTDSWVKALLLSGRIIENHVSPVRAVEDNIRNAQVLQLSRNVFYREAARIADKHGIDIDRLGITFDSSKVKKHMKTLQRA
jgi:hypothetical protein